MDSHSAWTVLVVSGLVRVKCFADFKEDVNLVKGNVRLDRFVVVDCSPDSKGVRKSWHCRNKNSN